MLSFRAKHARSACGVEEPQSFPTDGAAPRQESHGQSTRGSKQENTDFDGCDPFQSVCFSSDPCLNLQRLSRSTSCTLYRDALRFLDFACATRVLRSE